INGLAGVFTDADLELLRSNLNVASIEEDGYAYTQSVTTQRVLLTHFECLTDANWDLGRISSKTPVMNRNPNALIFPYKYDSTAGAGTNVYIIETSAGQSIANSFTSPLPSGGYPDADGNGHGIHCAGTAVSHPYGVAKAANFIAVKILDDSGHGHISTDVYVPDSISGIDWVAIATTNSRRPSVVCVSLGGRFMDSVNAAADNLAASGVTTVVVAGDSSTDAADFSPASAPSVITVGATDINNATASFSNYGAVLATWAPGVNVISTWNDYRIKTLSGTSVATPYVVGFSAYLLGMYPYMIPSSVKSAIQSMALNGVLSGVRKFINPSTSHEAHYSLQ
ncbi:subtilisin-like protein, partial [Thelephora ganbajun]